MNDELDALIKRIASEHGIALSQDDPVLMMHTLNKVLLEQNQQAHAQLLNQYEAVLQENFNQWQAYASKKANALITTQQNKACNINSQNAEQCMQLISEKIRIVINHEIRDLITASRQATIINRFAAAITMASIAAILLIM
jgi:ribonuclease HIII